MPTFVPLSRACFHFSVVFRKAFCVLWFFPNPVNSGENLVSEKIFIWLKTILSNILDVWERILNGDNFLYLAHLLSSTQESLPLTKYLEL